MAIGDWHRERALGGDWTSEIGERWPMRVAIRCEREIRAQSTMLRQLQLQMPMQLRDSHCDPANELEIKDRL